MLTGWLAAMGACALWALIYLVPALAPGFSDLDLACGRFMAAALMAGVALSWQRGPRVPGGWSRTVAGTLVALALLGSVVYFVLLQLAVRLAGASLVALVVGTIPLWMLLLGKPAGLRWWALLPSLALTATGLWLMALDAAPVSGGPAQRAGVLLALAAVASWTGFAFWNAAWLRHRPQWTSACWGHWLCVASGVAAALCWLVAGTPLQQLAVQPGWRQALAVCVGTGAGSAWLATVLWNMASRRLSAGLSGQLIVCETVFALLYAACWSGQMPSLVHWLAALSFVAGMLAALKAHTP